LHVSLFQWIRDLFVPEIVTWRIQYVIRFYKAHLFEDYNVSINSFDIAHEARPIGMIRSLVLNMWRTFSVNILAIVPGQLMYTTKIKTYGKF